MDETSPAARWAMADRDAKLALLRQYPSLHPPALLWASINGDEAMVEHLRVTWT